MEKVPVKEHLLSTGQRSAAMNDSEVYAPSIVIPINPDTPKLMPYNGYYALSNAAGAFFAVDTNMRVNTAAPEPVYDLTLIISMDGQRATRIGFTGTFDGTTLTQEWEPSGLSINLMFTRTVGSYGPVASCAGSIALPGQTAVSVSGTTYNNPIPASLFAGTYWLSGTEGTNPTQAMRIGPDNQLYYDNGSNDGQLQPVTSYSYNMNMYYFVFVQGEDVVRLIMGTASQYGFACNNMTVDASGSLVVRSMLTIPDAQKPPFEGYDLSSSQLADFSGYYSIQNAGSPLAFLSIQAQYVTLAPDTGWDLNYVMISLSPDGVVSEGVYFNPFTMSFDGETLHLPAQNITLKLTREYNAQNGSLVTMSGTIGGQAISGFTPFTPVPLSVFGGSPMTNKSGDTLTVNNDNSVTYNGTVMNSIIYVPLMYILAYPADGPNVAMSFGTDGTHGNACIVTTDANTPNPKTTSVWAIPA